MKSKYYKPGQLITIDHEVYRVTKTKDRLGLCCRYCVSFTGIGIFSSCLNKFKKFCHPREGKPLMPMDCYFKLVKLEYMKDKCYKPGQLITIEGRVYRIKKKRNCILICTECTMSYYCYSDPKIHIFCTKISHNCYLEPVK